MEVKPGYKQTEVGVIPEDWSARAVNEFALIKTGPFGTLLKASEYSKSDGVPLISVGEIREGYLRIEEQTPRVSEDVTRRLPQYLLKCGDIVFGRKGGVERSSLIRQSQEGWFLGSDGISVRPTIECYSEYVALQFQSARIRGWLLQNAIGTTMPSLNQEILSKVIIPFPPTKAEQEAIAELLSDADALIELLGQLIAKKHHIKQGVMQELLSGKRRLPGFVGDWNQRTLGELAKIRNEKINTLESPAAEFCVELEHIGQGNGTLEGYSDARDRLSSKYRFQAGDVLFGRLRPYLRKYWRADRDGVCSTEIWPLIPTGSDLDAGFLSHVVQTNSFIQAASAAYGTHMPRADWKAMSELNIWIAPTTEEQSSIAKFLSDMGAEIDALEAKLVKARQIKQGMMQELLNGRIRLV